MRRVAVPALAVLSLLCGPNAYSQQATRGPLPGLSYSEYGWFPVGDNFIEPTSGPGPVVSDPAHPYYSNQSGRQPTDRVADLSNPILQPWVRERLRKANADVLAGKVPYNPRETCHMAGVPDFDIFSRLRPVYFLQTPRQVTIINEGDQQVRRIFMNVPHSKNPKLSWYGESIGHYEGDTLVVDTLGLNDKTFIDNFLTPHTTQLHVVERYRVTGGGKTLDLDVTVEDPGAFTTIWRARQRYERRPQAIMEEAVCAENNADFFGHGYVPVPQAKAPDF
jgi:hypothetical protein